MYFCNVLEEFKQHIDTNFQILKDKTFLLACSGGLDSVVLTHLCHAIGLNFTLAHCNFQLRGIESSEDQKFVEKLAENKNVGIHVTIFKTVDYMNLNKVSLQVAARELRYAWFAKIMQENSIPTLVTAHHADDNLETFLINLSRGTGLDGLTGIPEKTDTIARPLFPFTREQIKAYAKKNAIVWREDKSNQETKYLRNKIRHTIVPLLKELHPTFLGNFLNTQAYLGQTAELVENLIKENNIYKIEIAALQKLHPQTTYVYHLFKPYGFSDARSIMALCEALSGKEILSASYRLLKDREHLLLQEETGTAILYVDTDTLKFPLTVRKWKTGDYFHPFGMKGVKKLSKFYKDEKYSLIAKETQWLLCSEDQIVWVIGKRADSRFKVSGKTKNILKFTVQNE